MIQVSTSTFCRICPVKFWEEKNDLKWKKNWLSKSYDVRYPGNSKGFNTPFGCVMGDANCNVIDGCCYQSKENTNNIIYFSYMSAKILINYC